MSVLVYGSLAEGKFKKSAKEAAYYAAQIAAKTGKQVVAVVLGTADAAELATLGKAGANKVLYVNDARFDTFDSKAYTKAIAEISQKEGAEYIVLPFDSKGKEVGPRLSARLKAGIVPGASELPNLEGVFSVKKNVFSGKGVAHYTINSAVKIISVNPNSIQVVESDAAATVETFASSFKIQPDSNVQIVFVVSFINSLNDLILLIISSNGSLFILLYWVNFSAKSCKALRMPVRKDSPWVSIKRC